VSTFAPFRHPAFRLLLIGRTVNVLGNTFAPIALAFAVLDLTGRRCRRRRARPHRRGGPDGAGRTRHVEQPGRPSPAASAPDRDGRLMEQLPA